MKKYVVSFLSILFLLFSCVSLYAVEPQVVRVGAFNYYPGIFKDADGVIKGFYVEALADIAQRENIRFEYVYGTWNEGLERLKSGEVDVLTSVAYTDDRSKFMDYGKTPLLTVWGELYTGPSPGIEGIKSVEGKKIAVMKGDFNGSSFIELVKKFNISCEFVEMPGFEDVFKAIAAKTVDAGVVNSTFGVPKQREYGLRSTGVVFNPFDIFFTVSKGNNQNILALLDTNLANWRHQVNSPYNIARQKWLYGKLGTIQVIPRWLVNTATALGALLAVAITFVILLRRQVRRATADIMSSKHVLMESEAKFRSYIDNAPEGVFVVNETGKYIEVNSATSSITGYSEAELLTKSIPDLIPPESLETALSHFQSLKDEGNSKSEFKYLHKSGEKRWWSVDAVKLYETVYLGFIKDITERKLSEESLMALKDTLQEQYEELQVNEESLRDQNDELLSAEEMLRVQIDDYALSQKRLEDSEERSKSTIELLQSVLENFPGVVFWKSTDLVYLGCNKPFSSAAGLAHPDEVIGKTDYDMPWGKAEAVSYMDCDRKVIESGEAVYHIMESQLQADGHTAWFETCKIPLRNSHGDVWGVLGVSFDISERKRAEAYRDLSRDILQKLNEPQSIQDSIQSIVTTLKANTKFDAVGIRLQRGEDFPYSASEGLSEDFLLTENSLIERLPDKRVCRDKDGNACLECTCGLVITGNADLTLPFFSPGGSFWINDSYPLLDIPSDEEPRHHPRNECIHRNYASVALIPIRSKDRIVGLIQLNDQRKGCFTPTSIEILEGIGAQIGSALMRKQAEAEKLAIELQFQQTQKLESLGVLAGGIAHDFNNILAIILGHCYMAKENRDSGITDKEHFQKIEIAGNRAADLCSQMLTYAGKSQLVQTQINLSFLIDEVVKMLSSAIKKNVTFKLNLKRDVPEITGDKAQIQQIVMNLIINAAEAIGDKEGVISIRMTKVTVIEGESNIDFAGNAIAAGTYAYLAVSDTGCGIDGDTQKRIFEPFFTTKFTGRGLGMSVILGIIKSHDGALQLTSSPDVGTDFKVYLPIPAVPEIIETALVNKLAPIEKAKGTILLVDDEESLRTIGSSLLIAMGFSVLIASNGFEALELYRLHEDEIDLVMLDLIMPKMGGIETYHELRKTAPNLSIIICSGYGAESVEDTINDDMHASFVLKPYKPGDLRNVMVGMIE